MSECYCRKFWFNAEDINFYEDGRMVHTPYFCGGKQGYTSKQLVQAMNILPPPESVEGFKLEYRRATFGEEYYCVDDWEACFSDSTEFKYLVRVPITEA